MYFFEDKATGEYPITPDMLRERHKSNVSFGPTVPHDVADVLGYFTVHVEIKPAYDASTHDCTAAAPLVDAAGVRRQGWVVAELPADVVLSNTAAARALTRAAEKAARELSVGQITVTTAAGNTFDGDETSQNRMARAILALQATSTPATLWVLSDNSVIEASVAELAEALALSGAAQSALWVIE